MLFGETNVLEYLFTIFMGREAKRLYLCASNKYDFLRRGGGGGGVEGPSTEN